MTTGAESTEDERSGAAEDDRDAAAYLVRNRMDLLTDEERLALWGAQIAASFGAHRALKTPMRDKVARALQLVPGLTEAADADDPKAAALEALHRYERLLLARVLSETSFGDEIARCPACNRILRTPEARQCLACGHDGYRD